MESVLFILQILNVVGLFCIDLFLRRKGIEMPENKNDLSESDVERINSLIYIFMWQLQASQKQQHIELINAFNALVKYLKEEKRYSELIKEIKFSPIKFCISMKKDLFTKDEMKKIDLSYQLPELDFIYFRDTTMSYKLKKVYRSTHAKRRRYDKMINLSQIIVLLSFIREWVFAEFIMVTRRHNLAIPQIQLPQSTQHSLEGVGIVSKK